VIDGESEDGDCDEMMRAWGEPGEKGTNSLNGMRLTERRRELIFLMAIPSEFHKRVSLSPEKTRMM